MKLTLKVIVSILLVISAIYYGSAFVMPSVTVVNKSGGFVDHVEVALPSSNLNFGALMESEENTLHYSLEQTDGVYNYQFKSKNSVVISGSCGYVTKNEIHKRALITLSKNYEVVCS